MKQNIGRRIFSVPQFVTDKLPGRRRFNLRSTFKCPLFRF
ncbi:unnamed protein product [Acanthoscelides obtectus]|uniref:Uncharacterized protein n=1 Tax=Acanthoscelides obtectus TaxID=200917 RepID=A0A9P0L9B0_ACAOB|nr:unnamed protein product [Acanthoscelides obtectus]CAK1620866.1 hypothetical protein AOBTE_LOCUS627 [Acanthoscelides obtectus]